METFPFVAYGDRKKTITALNRRIEFENGMEQVAQVAVNPKVIFERTFSGLHEELLEIQRFFYRHAPGGKVFYYVDEEDVQHTVRFASDSCELTEKYGCDEYGFGVKAYSCTLQFRKVWPT